MYINKDFKGRIVWQPKPIAPYQKGETDKILSIYST